MTIEELITFCEEEEYNHRLKCKRYDDASGYTRSKDKNIRTACAIRETTYADFYKEISDIMRKYQKIEQKSGMTLERALYNERKEAVEVARDLCINDELTIAEQDIVKPILDKIREEVESIEHYATNDGNGFWLRTPEEIKKDVLDILDKYKAESEDREND